MYLKTKQKAIGNENSALKTKVLLYIYVSHSSVPPPTTSTLPDPPHPCKKMCRRCLIFPVFKSYEFKTEYGKANKYNLEHNYSNITFIEYHKLCHVILNCPGKQAGLITPILQRWKNTEMLSLVTQVVQGHTFRRRASSGFNALFS